MDRRTKHIELSAMAIAGAIATLQQLNMHAAANAAIEALGVAPDERASLALELLGHSHAPLVWPTLEELPQEEAANSVLTVVDCPERSAA